MKQDNLIKKTPIFLGYFLIAYGLLYIILNNIDLFYESNKLLLVQTFGETLPMRMISLIFCITIVFGGYLILKNNKDSWYFINFGCLGIVLKYLFTYIFFARLTNFNFLHVTGIHGVIAILVIILANTKWYKIRLRVSKKNISLKILSLAIAATVVLILFNLENLIYKYKQKQINIFEQKVLNTHKHIHFDVDTCFFDEEFLKIIDTLQNINDYNSIECVSLNADSIPIYSEEISLFQTRVISKRYRFDSIKNEIHIDFDNDYSYPVYAMINDFNYHFSDLDFFPYEKYEHNLHWEIEYYFHHGKLVKINNYPKKHLNQPSTKEIIIFTRKRINNEIPDNNFDN